MKKYKLFHNVWYVGEKIYQVKIRIVGREYINPMVIKYTLEIINNGKSHKGTMNFQNDDELIKRWKIKEK